MSIRSPPSSSTMFLMRLPRTPTQAPDAIDLLIDAADGDLGAVARLAGDGADRDDAVGDLGDLLLEEPLHEVGLRAAEDDLDAAALRLTSRMMAPDALVGMVRLAGDLLAARAGSLRCCRA